MKEQIHSGEGQRHRPGVTMAWSPGPVLKGVRGPNLAVPTPGLVRGSRHLVVSFEVTTPPESPFEPGGCLSFGFLISLGLLASVGLALGFPPSPSPAAIV